MRQRWTEEGWICQLILRMPNRLITIIEDYDLYKYDSKGLSKRAVRDWEKLLKKKPWLANPHKVYLANGLAYRGGP